LISLSPAPVLARLEWLLAGLAGTRGWGGDADEVLATEFTDQVSARRLIEVTKQRASRLAPLEVIGVETADVSDGIPLSAIAKVRRTGGEVQVVRCSIQPTPPHRITSTWVAGLVPQFLTPGLPMTFDPAGSVSPMQRRTTATQLIVFSGVPGSGKSTLAEGVGRRIGVPVFAADWLLGALTPYGGYHLGGLSGIAEEQLTTLAYRQLELSQSVILDAPTESVPTRERWASLAAAFGARLVVVVCVCSDPDLHRARVEQRTRGIPGWHDAGDWTDVQRRLAAFPAWPGSPLVVDAVQPSDHGVSAVIDHLHSDAE